MLPESEDDNAPLEQVTFIVSRSREHVARQREIIAELKTMGLDTKSAETPHPSRFGIYINSFSKILSDRSRYKR